ncbi:hypothetical protein JRO89_XS11G0013000 [Xanthoceras sorbifolium]|uniref:Uncharacterized protein n=1 Tax=Xanthoceras sorbifolium TaxID=99658 RepID=A0ABQ8HE64_9ROSI|nr:hypothetical protein JRO89_XS11G0013000 [Xanthoceras sorbifolium]
MEATKFLSSTTIPLPFHNPQVSSSSSTTRRKKPFTVFTMAAARGGGGPRNYGGGGNPYGSGRTVDEDMIVLRMRIREQKMLETRSEQPTNWMEWEKKYYANNGYDEDICEALGLLQNYLMNMRPAFALGLIALIALSLVVSTGMAVFHAVRLAQIIILSEFH